MSLGFRAHRHAVTDPASVRPTLVIHIGTPKTGTTSFQTMVARNESHFPFVYPATGRVGAAHHGIAWELRDGPGLRGRFGTLARLVRELRAARASAALVSSELFTLLYERPDRLAKLRDAVVAAGYRPHIVVMLRDPCSYLESLYPKLRRRGFAMDFDRFVAYAVADGGLRWGRGGDPLDYGQIVASFAAVFGTQAVTTVRYEPTDAISPLLAAIGSALDVPLTAVEGWDRFNTRENVRSCATLSSAQRSAVRAKFFDQFEALTSGSPLVDALGEVRPSGCSARPDDAAVVHDACPVCQAASPTTGISVTTDRTYTVLRCRRCGLAFMVPRPPMEQLAGRYHDAYFRYGHGCRYYPGYRPGAVHASRTWEELGVWAPATRGVRHALLDIGAGTGEFAARAVADGWSVTACEPADPARTAAAAKGMATVADLDEAADRFGLITMFQVLEHVPDPVAMLRRCRELIDDDGLLVIVLPHWRSAVRIVRRQLWNQLQPPEHINFFTRSSLSFALDRTGWALASVSTPYPSGSGPDLRTPIAHRDARATVRRLGELVLGVSGFGPDLRALARPG